jgi:hypothetical protein
MADVPAPTRAELVEALRNQLFEEVVNQADQAASLCRSLGEAAYRGNETLTALHVGELRKVLLAIIETRDALKRAERPRDQDLAAKGNSAGRGDDQRAGDGPPRG